MTDSSAARTINRAVSALTLGSLGALHLAWAAGSHWPATSERALADAVIGGTVAPSPIPTAVVGVALMGSGLAAGAGRGRAARVLRLLLGTAFTARMLVGGSAPARVLGVAHPSATFRRWDRRVYRPLCGAFGLLLLADAALA